MNKNDQLIANVLINKNYNSKAIIRKKVNSIVTLDTYTEYQNTIIAREKRHHVKKQKFVLQLTNIQLKTYTHKKFKPLKLKIFSNLQGLSREHKITNYFKIAKKHINSTNFLHTFLLGFPIKGGFIGYSLGTKFFIDSKYIEIIGEKIFYENKKKMENILFLLQLQKPQLVLPLRLSCVILNNLKLIDSPDKIAEQLEIEDIIEILNNDFSHLL